jgi:hypothetical protein
MTFWPNSWSPKQVRRADSDERIGHGGRDGGSPSHAGRRLSLPPIRARCSSNKTGPAHEQHHPFSCPLRRALSGHALLRVLRSISVSGRTPLPTGTGRCHGECRRPGGQGWRDDCEPISSGCSSRLSWHLSHIPCVASWAIQVERKLKRRFIER